jgi:phosphoenolpyruvate carboxylase
MKETLEIVTDSTNHHHECKCLTNQTNVRYKLELSELQREYDKVKNNEYQQSYLIEEQKKRIEDLGKTLKLYESENKALRELVRLWV